MAIRPYYYSEFQSCEISSFYLCVLCVFACTEQSEVCLRGKTRLVWQTQKS